MSADCVEFFLGDFINFKNGKTSPDRTDEEAHPVYGSNGIIGFCDKTNAEDRSLIIGRVGSYCGSVYHSFKKCWVTDNAIIGTPVNESESEFWYFLLIKLKLNSYRSGSGQPLLNQGTLNSIKVRIPRCSATRELIGQHLMHFNKKIELNRQINQTLEQIAQTIFKSWFVDFEPVKAKIAAKAAGHDPERAAMCAISGKTAAELDQLTAEQRQQLAATAALFPDELVESELGLVPVGWSVKRLENLLELSYGKALKKTDRKDGDIPVYGSGGVTGHHNQHLVEGPGIIVGRKGTVGSLYWEDNNFFPIDTVFYVKPLNSTPLIFLFHLLQTLGLESMNTDAAVPGLNRKNVYRLLVPSFQDDLVKIFTEQMSKLRTMQSNILFENNNLVKIRDILLPKLLSGELPPLIPPMK